MIIGALYLLMARRLHSSAKEIPGDISVPQNKAQARSRKYVARLVVAFIVGKIIRN